MERVLTYYIDENYLMEKGESLKYRLQQWLSNYFKDVTVLMFILGNESSIIIDYEYESADPKIIKNCVNLFLDKFDIKYQNC